MLDLRRWLKNGDTQAAQPPEECISLLFVTQADEDSEQLRRIARDLGWIVRVARGTSEAVNSLQEDPASVVICDHDLPTEDWRQMVSRMAALPRSNCVLLASGVMDQYLWNEVIQCRGFDVVSKPFQKEELRRTVTFAVQNSRPRA
jgi:DNA-binding NtrC family response regulator